MNKNEKLLIDVLNAYLKGEGVELSSDIDYQSFFELIKQHNLTAIAFSVVKNSDFSVVPREILKIAEDGFCDAIMRHTNQSAVQEEIDEILSDNEIRHIFFKGAEIKNYFPIPEVRAMGDVDVLIAPQDRDRVKSLLTDNGFKLTDYNGPVYNYHKNDVIIEMHTKIVSGKVGSANAESNFLDAIEHGIFEGYNGILEPEYNFAYLLTHIAHHFWFYGAGAKLILDLAVMLNHYDINLDVVLNKTDEIGLTDFSKIIISICYKWFGVGSLYTEDTAPTESFLLGFGAFGNANRNLASVVKRKELEEGKKPSSIKTRLRLLFPSYEKMKNIPYMKFIENRPYLIVLGWIYRLFYNLKHKRSFLIEVNKGLDSDESTYEAQNELKYFKEIGLL